MRPLLFLLLLTPSLLIGKEYPFFHPPNEWLISDPKHYAPSVTICFIPPNKSGFSPSINLAIEPQAPPLEEYIEHIRTLHLKSTSKRWRNLGPLQAHGITGVLTEIDTASDGKELRMLQCIFVQNDTAYILTAAAPKKTIANYYQPFLSSFKSFTISQNLLESIPEIARRDTLQKRLTALRERHKEKEFEKRVWAPFEKSFLKEFADMGAHWQILVIKEERENYEKTPSKHHP